MIGFFLNYKALTQNVSDVILEIKPDFPYPHALASNLFEMANNHIYFALHLPRLTDVKVENDNFDEVEEIRELAKELPYDFWVVLVGDMITEEALPTYESWLMDVEGVDQVGEGGNSWSKWVKHWTAEENRHGDVLNKYFKLSNECYCNASDEDAGSSAFFCY